MIKINLLAQLHLTFQQEEWDRFLKVGTNHINLIKINRQELMKKPSQGNT